MLIFVNIIAFLVLLLKSWGIFIYLFCTDTTFLQSKESGKIWDQQKSIKPCKATLHRLHPFNNDTFLGLLISLMTPLKQLAQWNVGRWRLKLKWTICSGAPPEVEGFQLENQHISRVKCVSRVHYSTGGTVFVAGLTAQLPHGELQL